MRRDYWGEYAMTFIYDLHYRLLLGEPGGRDGRVGRLWRCSAVAERAMGLVAARSAGAKALRFKRDARRCGLRDWHKLAGLAGWRFC